MTTMVATPPKTAPGASPLAIYAMFAASGAAALVYQVIWARWLGLVFGNTTTSVSVVLGTFMTGLALGSWLAGRLIPRVGNPVRLYALLELAIGLFAVSFPALSRLTAAAFVALVGTDSSTAWSLSVRVLLSFALLLVPTTLMGATLPLLTDFFRRSPRHNDRLKAGLLYAANTLGAAIGTIAASFFLIELFGVPATTLVAAALNVGVALFAFALSGSGKLAPNEDCAGAGERWGSAARFAAAVLAGSGAAAMASEVLWTRTLETLIGNSTYAFAMILLVYLSGIAAGSWLASLIVKRCRVSALWLAILLAGMGLWTRLAVMLFESSTRSFPASGVPIPLVVIFWNYARSAGILFPLALISGACFPIALRLIDPDARDASGVHTARACAWNTAGALAGSLLGGFLIAPRFDYLESLDLLAFLYCLAALGCCAAIVLNKGLSGRGGACLATGLVSLACAALALVNATGGSRFVKRFNADHPALEMVFHRPGLQGVTSAWRVRGQQFASNLLVNGTGMTVKITDTKMMAHFPLMLHPHPDNTLVICFGMGTTYRSAIAHGGKVTVVELVREVLDAFDCFHADASRVRAYPKGRMVVNDGRNFLALTAERFDVITVDPAPPIDAAGATSLHSKEFIELAKSRLARGGIMAHWIPYPFTVAGVDDWQSFNMLVESFAEVFPFVYGQSGLHNGGLHLIGSMEPLDISPSRLLLRAAEPAVARDMNEWEQVPASYLAGIQPIVRDGAPPPAVTDERPRLEFYLLRTLRSGGMKIPSFHANYW